MNVLARVNLDAWSVDRGAGDRAYAGPRSAPGCRGPLPGLTFFRGDPSLRIDIDPVAVPVAAGCDVIAVALGHDIDHLAAGQAQQRERRRQILGERCIVRRG